ncbi:MAG: porin family protein [Gammaproteobacteria bacterium]|nr:porin family protein [Gammaproteobacteria bacterium]
MKNFNFIRTAASILILASTALTSPLFAASVSWIGADAMQWTYNPDEVDKLSATTGKIRGGIEYSDYFGVETHFAMGGSDTVTVQNTEVKVDLDYMWGVFVRASYPISAAKLYGIFGASNLMMSIDSDVLSGVDRITRLSYGAGAEYLINENWVINADYIVYLKSESFTFSGISAGLRYRFH